MATVLTQRVEHSLPIERLWAITMTKEVTEALHR